MLFREHVSYVVHTLRRLGVREADVEDVAHEVFLIVHRRLATYDPARPIRRWIFGIALRVAADYRKLARTRYEAPTATIDARDSDPMPDERLAAEQLRSTVIAALDALDLDRRAVLILHDIEEVPVPAVAETLGIPVNTAYSRLRLARADFKRALARKKGGST
jgi:RNA polymerase sigma-70 factor (ECF subfamily)